MSGRARELGPAVEARDIYRLGSVLPADWELKRQLAPGISDLAIEEMYAQARRFGALGGKICGAGGGGFLLTYCPLAQPDRLLEGMAAYRRMPFQLEPDGSKVIFNYQRDFWK